MRPLVFACALAIVGISLVAAAPSASAVGWCTAAGPADHQCREHLACVGWGWDSRGERCQYGVDEPCWYWNCFPPL